MELLLMIKILLLTFVISSLANRDTRPCKEKILGPLLDNNSTTTFHSRVADENNTVTLRCRVNCQDPGAYYTPHIKVITTVDGEEYIRRENNLFDTTIISPNTDSTCSTTNQIRDYEFLLTIASDKMNESIAMCGLRYSFTNFSEYCYVPVLAWIILPDRPTTTMPPATTMPTTTTTIEPITATTTDITTQEITTTTVPPTTSTDGPNTITEKDNRMFNVPTTSKPADIEAQESIPDEVSYLFITVAILCIVIVLSMLALFLYKKFGNNRKRKISSEVPLGSLVIQAPGPGEVLKCEDIETQSVKFRTSAQS